MSEALAPAAADTRGERFAGPRGRFDQQQIARERRPAVCSSVVGRRRAASARTTAACPGVPRSPRRRRCWRRRRRRRGRAAARPARARRRVRSTRDPSAHRVVARSDTCRSRRRRRWRPARAAPTATIDAAPGVVPRATVTGLGPTSRPRRCPGGPGRPLLPNGIADGRRDRRSSGRQPGCPAVRRR